MPFTIDLNTKAPDFSLPGTDGKTYSLKSFTSPILVVSFTLATAPRRWQ